MLDVRASTGELRAVGGFLRGLGPFLAAGVPPLVDLRALVVGQLAGRERTFALVLDRAVFGNPYSPYRRLIAAAGLTKGDIDAMLAADGLETTLEQMHAAGVYVTLEEFKGRVPIRRHGLELPVRRAADFDNPMTLRQYEAETGGSSGTPRPIQVDLDLLECETVYHALFYAAADAARRPVGIWHLAPPGAVGLKAALIHARLGWPAERWFSQRRIEDAPFKHAAFARAALKAVDLYGAHVPVPEYTPAADARRVAQWLASAGARGTPAVLLATASGAVRACAAALSEKLDIAGTLFVIVGEPYTAAKEAVVTSAGCRALSHYAMTETGLIGLACASSPNRDDVHLLGGKVATIERPRWINQGHTTVPALFHTTVNPSSPKILLNVESGDLGVRTSRKCDCGALPGHTDHLHTIRSYEKLTSEGMHLLGVDLLALVEDVLPARFGGHPTDYQFVEREEHGFPRVSLLVRPSVRDVDEDRMVEAVLQFLRDRGTGQHLMADVWAQGRTLYVVRGNPLATPGGKIPPLRTLAG